MPRSAVEPVAFDHPANARVLVYLETASMGGPTSAAPESVDRWQLGTHPDLVEIFWDRLTALLPEPCQWVVHGSPVLVHPETGVLFGLAGGTSTTALRLPERERAEAFEVAGYGRAYAYPRATIYASDMGEQWALIEPGSAEPRAARWCLSAYRYAGPQV